MRVEFTAVMAAGLALSACAGRDPQPIATVQVQDTNADCTQLRAEIEGNNLKLKQLSDEQGGKVAQNVAAGVAGIIIWPIWFGMDFKDAAGKEVAAVQARQQYLTTLATERCAAPPVPPPAAAAPAPRHAKPKPLPQARTQGTAPSPNGAVAVAPSQN